MPFRPVKPRYAGGTDLYKEGVEFFWLLAEDDSGWHLSIGTDHSLGAEKYHA